MAMSYKMYQQAIKLFLMPLYTSSKVKYNLQFAQIEGMQELNENPTLKSIQYTKYNEILMLQAPSK